MADLTDAVDPRLVALGLGPPPEAAAADPAAPDPVPQVSVAWAATPAPPVPPAPVAPAPPVAPARPAALAPVVPPARPVAPAPQVAPARPAAPLPPAAQPSLAAAPPPEPILGARTNGIAVPVFSGFPARLGQLTFDTLGIHVTSKEPFGVLWSAVTHVDARRGEVLIRTNARRLALTVAVDRVVEPALAGPLVRLLAEARGGSLERSGSALLEFRNAADRLREEFLDEDDLFTPGVIGLVLAASAATCVAVAPHILALGASPAVLNGVFVLDSPLSPLDPRSLLIGLAAAAMLTSLIVRVASRGQAVAWARGTLRGWHRGRPVSLAARGVLATIIHRPAISAAVLLLGVALALPTARTLVVFDGAGVKVVRELPFLDEERSWRAVADISAVPAPLDRHPSGVAVVVLFADGASISTLDRYIRGGTDKQFFDVARTWRAAATERGGQ